MPQLESLLSQIIEKKKHLDELRSQSPEMAEALAVSDLYHGLMEDLRKMCDMPDQRIVPMPYPVYPPVHPAYPYPTIVWSDTTAPTNGTIRIVK